MSLDDEYKYLLAQEWVLEQLRAGQRVCPDTAIREQAWDDAIFHSWRELHRLGVDPKTLTPAEIADQLDPLEVAALTQAGLLPLRDDDDEPARRSTRRRGRSGRPGGATGRGEFKD